MAESQYWTGPYGIKVFKDVMRITDSDGRNKLHRDGGSTEMAVMNPPSKQEYLKKYCVLGTDGNYYWNKNLPSTLQLV